MDRVSVAQRGRANGGSTVRNRAGQPHTLPVREWLPAHGQRTGAPARVELSDLRPRLAATADIARKARRELIVVAPGAAAAIVMRHLGATFLDLSGDGVQIKVLLTPPTDSCGTNQFGLRPVSSVAVRFALTPVQELVIVDGRTALVGTAAQAVSTSDTAVIGSLYALFNSVWELSNVINWPRKAVSDLDGDVLAQLCDGLTDEVAARRLGISVRTYRRYVAKIMLDLGATSRFQAGMLVCEQGVMEGNHPR
jgi:hypothetical protein